MDSKNGMKRIRTQRQVGVMIIVVLLIVVSVSCKKRNTERIEDNLFALDTYITFAISPGKDSRAGLDKAINRIKEIEQRMSVTLPGSDIYKVNQAAGRTPVKVHADTFFVIQKAIRYGELTNGNFDITIRPISKLWDISGDNPRIPEKEEIEETLPLVDYKKIKLDRSEQTVFLEEEGMAIDLGGIAKGFAGDEVMRILKDHGVTHGLINLGGNIVVLNNKEDGTSWRIGIQNPRVEEDKEKRRHVVVVAATDKSVVTSGDYERYLTEEYEKTGVRYHHIFDPASGYSSRNGVISVTIVSSSGVDADALSTAVFVLGAEDGLELINQLEGIQAMVITEDKEIHVSNGFEDQVSGIHPDYHLTDK